MTKREKMGLSLIIITSCTVTFVLNSLGVVDNILAGICCGVGCQLFIGG